LKTKAVSSIEAHLKPASSAAIELSVSRKVFSVAFIESANCGWVEESVSATERILHDV
jgi:hypothetical protein